MRNLSKNSIKRMQRRGDTVVNRNWYWENFTPEENKADKKKYNQVAYNVFFRKELSTTPPQPPQED